MDAGRPDDFGQLSPTQAWRVDAVCRRFEADWRAGRGPRIKDYLVEVGEPGRPALLQELLALELELRRGRGEHPDPGAYHARFPDQPAVVDDAFAKAPPPDRTRAERLEANRPRADAGRGLLLGLLAFQNNFIDRDALLGAFTTWIADRARSMGRVLLERGALDSDTLALLEALARKHLDLHGGDPEQSLASLGVVGAVRRDLEQIADPELQISLSHVATGRGTGPDPDATRTLSAGQPTSTGERFRVLRPHAKGGLGEVYVARDEELKREVALKQIQDRYADDPQSRSRFIVEAEITGGLEHPGIIPIYGFGAYADGRPFYAMRFIKGDSLKDAIQRFHRAEGPGLDPGERVLELHKLLRRFIDVCNTIAYAHSRGVLHRDLKPGNILLGPFGETLVVDWGLAKVIGRPEGMAGLEELTLLPASAGRMIETLPGSALGTPAYMSPEQAAGELERLGPASDVYSLGATLYCLLTGQPPFSVSDAGTVQRAVRGGEFPRPRDVDPRVDRALEAICLKAMSLRAAARYESSQSLASDVERWLADEPVSAYREPLLARLWRWQLKYASLLSAGYILYLTLTMWLTASYLTIQSYKVYSLNGHIDSFIIMLIMYLSAMWIIVVIGYGLGSGIILGRRWAMWAAEIFYVIALSSQVYSLATGRGDSKGAPLMIGIFGFGFLQNTLAIINRRTSVHPGFRGRGMPKTLRL